MTGPSKPKSAADRAVEERVSFSNSLHADFLHQVEELLTQSGSSEADRKEILANLNCPCCGGSAVSFTVKLKDKY